MDNLNANVVTNTMRQVMAKVPGIHIWESDGSGIQIGIGARGLSANRSWEFNIRQNGYDISSDPFGYPEAYYTPQLQAVQRIQVVRGAGALQYGPQFGGMVNFVLRDGSDIKKPFLFETQNTAGSSGLFNSYNAIGGDTKKVNYYAFYDHRNANGWRQNSRYYTNTGFGTIHYKINEKLKIGAEVMRWNMQSQQPGGLTDQQFADDAKQSFRSRNWFNITWNTVAVNMDYGFNTNTRLNVKIFTVAGDRNSIGYLKAINITDSINPATLHFDNRTVDIDRYKNIGAESRFLTDYKINRLNSTLSAGLRYYHGNTKRYRNGKGDTGSEYNNNILSPFPTDVDLKSNNFSAFAENIFHISDNLIIIPGVRYEHLNTTAAGRLSFNTNGSENKIGDESRERNFILLGIGAEYHIAQTEFYGNYSEAYRPMLFSDLTASPTTDVIDENLKDARGYNIDIGYRGKVKDYLFFDISAYYLKYKNRIGLITQQKTDGSFYNFRTNVGTSNSKGIEAMIEFNPVKAFVKNSNWGDVSFFISASQMDARYDDFKVVTKNGNALEESNLKDKKVENAPSTNIRTGSTYNFKNLSLTAQLSYTSKTFSDANNTFTPTANGQTGLIPSYTIGDISLSYKIKEEYNIKAGVNNIGNKRYFTRRAGGYPGPGLLPADGRSFYVSVGAKL